MPYDVFVSLASAVVPVVGHPRGVMIPFLENIIVPLSTFSYIKTWEVNVLDVSLVVYFSLCLLKLL